MSKQNGVLETIYKQYTLIITISCIQNKWCYLVTLYYSCSMASEKQGYLGNLEDKSIQELQELLTREENILRKK